MTIRKFLLELRNLGVTFFVQNGKLHSKSEKGVLNIEQRKIISSRKAEIISFLLNSFSEMDPEKEESRSIPIAKRGKPFPLSFGQERLWFIDQFRPGNTFYNVPFAVKFLGGLNIEALSLALNEIIRRHEVLRTVFPMVDGAPVQIIVPSIYFKLPVTKLDGMSSAEREKSALQIVRDEAEVPFDLTSGPLIRAGLICLQETEHIFFITLHHIVVDGWSTGVFIHELVALYSAYIDDLPSPLPELSIQYGDFSCWQRQRLTGETLQRQLDYWKANLSGAQTLLSLPTDRTRPPVQSHSGAALTIVVSAETTKGLLELGIKTRTTLFMTLTAAFNILLSRYSGQSDICLGTPIANRNRSEIESLIGFFVNTLVLRTHVDEDAVFTELLEQVRRTALDAYANQDVPFEQVVETLRPERHLSHSALFQVMLVLQNSPMGSHELPGLVMEPVAAEGVTAKFDLTLNVSQDSSGQLHTLFEYNTDLFDRVTIERMAGHFVRLLEAIVQDPGAQVGTLDMLSNDERKQILIDWNDTATDYPKTQSIHQLFERQVDQDAEAIALIFEGKELTYGELNARANQLAHHLRSVGVSSDTLVGICVERSLEMIVGLLGILKAGGAYVPLDPTYPNDRLAYMIADAKPALLLTQYHLSADLPSIDTVAFCLDSEWEKLRHYSTDNPVHQSSPESLAYVIYTSGSTGVPKGTLLEHGGLCNLIHNHAAQFAIQPKQRILQFASLSFDASTWEIFLALSCGATLCLGARDDLMPGGALEATLTQLEITTAILPPVVLSAMLAQPFPHLKTLLVAGEACPRSLVEQWAGNYRFFNAYGPTETTILALVQRCHADRPGPPPIGRPVANMQIYILDRHLKPVPVGVAGELHIAGRGLARGYLNRPDLTDEKFIPNPYGAAGTRMYRSGDLARYAADGSIEYLGRIDNQVKIRGFRIELGEIEAVLSAQENVQDVVVLVRQDGNGDKRLVAYLVMRGEGTSAEALRMALRQSLPDFMVPAAFVMLESFPLTPNGKVDRKALPEPDMSGDNSAYVAPETATEELLATIWADILKVDRVGIHDNFFALGGHSLLATQVISKVRSEFKIDMPLRAIFETPTIFGFSPRIDAEKNNSLADAEFLIVRFDGSNAPLSFAQQRLWFLDQLAPGSTLYHVPMVGKLIGQLDVNAMRRAFNEIVRRHEVLRTNFVIRDGAPAQIVAPLLELKMTVTDVRSVPPAERRAKAMQIAQEEIQVPFDLANGPLVRLGLVCLRDTEHLLLITLHHIISDGWSLGVLIKELVALYSAYIDDLPSALPELSIQYGDFSCWQRQRLTGETLQRQLDYWKANLSGAQTLLSLPTDRTRPPVQSHSGAALTIVVSAETTKGLLELGIKTRTTLFMTLTAAFNILLSRYSGQSDICLGTPIANRNRSEIESLIGFFVNTLVLRTHVDEDAVFTELLEQVRRTALDAYANQDVPFEQVVETLRPERHLSHSALFQVMLVLQNSPMGSHELPGLVMEPVAAEGVTAKFDLTLNVSQDSSGQLHTLFEYNTDLFDRVTIERMAGHFVRLLEAIVQDPGAQVGTLDMLSNDERKQILIDWNDTATDYPKTQSIHQLFERQVDQDAEAIALIFEGKELTYGELNARANQLAHHLRSVGVSSDTLVGICVERSLEMIVGLLGILKAGGAYVPLDPTYPNDRLAYMIADAKPALLLTQYHLSADLPSIDTVAFCLDSEWEKLRHYSTDNPVHQSSPESLAYVIYTSGSTGVPKGTLLEHGGLCNLIHNYAAQFAIQPQQRILQFASLSFDASTLEIFLALSCGATLCLGARDDLMPGGALEATLTQLEITTAILPPVVLSAMLAQPFPHLKTLLVAGEACPRSLVEQWAGNYRFFNAYGPTEATIAVSDHLCHADRPGPPPIGRPVANMQIYILDRHLKPVPVGVAGELHIAGRGLARGYLNRPDLTDEKFIPNPYGAAGARMYRSGDLARYAADGSIEYLGRIDNQVKIRGFRVELGEIEAVLSAQENVQDVVVLVRQDGNGDKRLVAYLVMRGEGTSAEALRMALRQSLPDFMVPAAFVMLESFPLTPNGKVDRKALPEPDMSGDNSAYVAPETATEELLATIWADILKVDRVGIHDNFFALGGHSLLATQVISKVRSEFKIDMPLRAIFETPTIFGFSPRIDAEKNNSLADAESLIVRFDGSNAPLSFAQQRLWFLDQLAPGSTLYHVPMVGKLIGQLDVNAMRRAFNEIVRRHEVLRTNFVIRDGAPVQIVAPLLELKMTVTDVRSVPPAERRAKAMQIAQEEIQVPFDLANGPLVRLGLVCLRDTEHLLLITLHHIISDGWSLGVLIKELVALYSAYIDDLPSALPELSIQYGDFSCWQRQRLTGETLQRQLDYWKANLSGAQTLLSLPTDRTRPPVQSHSGAALTIVVSAETTKGLLELGIKTRTTLFMTLTAAFNILLSRYSGQSDICLGTPIANRNRSEIESLIGFFVNTLVLRTHVDEDAVFTELLEQVRRTALDAYANQDVPFEQVVETLRPERHLSHSALFQVMLVLQNSPMGSHELPGLVMEPVAAEGVTAKFDLTLNVSQDSSGQLHTLFEYNTDLFDRVTIERMAGHFVRLLEAIVQDPGAQVGTLDMLSNDERKQILIDWNDTATDYPKTQSIHQLFERQVDQDAEAIALIFEGKELTYGELNARANQLAHHLRSVGVSSDTLVGICVERSLEMIVGLLGILKAGGAYVPLDPTYPNDRLAYMIADAKPALLLTQYHLSADLPSIDTVAFCLDSEWEKLRHYSTDNPVHQSSPESLAYVIYTSGSTGVPKGTLLEHGGLCNLIHNHAAQFAIQPQQRILQFASLSFDVSTWEIFLALSCGATLCLGPRDDLMPGGALEATLTQLEITTAILPPVVLSAMLAQPFPHLKTLLVAGEACPRSLVEQWAGNYRFFNAYGPTEATILASVQRCHADRPGPPPIGRPVANMQIYILDRHLKPVPVGVAGELHIAGRGLARGYLNRPDLTDEKFIPNPYGAAGTRMYRSGDLARYAADGSIEYLGRIDNQVKIRGFRVELGEIEAVLSAQENVQDVVVLVRQDGNGDKRLVAYLVMRGEGTSAEALRMALRQSLPDFMVPAAFVMLESFPLTPNGKVDRKALPEPDMSGDNSAYVAPETATEELLATIWADILKVDRVGIHDNFFALGGHSLLATQVISKVRSEFKIDMPLRAIFETPTIFGFSPRIDAEKNNSLADAESLIVRFDGSNAPLSFAQQRLWFLDQLAPGSTLYHVPMVGKLIGQLDVNAMRRAFNEIVRRHEVLRTNFVIRDGAPVQIVAPLLELKMTVTDVRSVPPAERRAKAMQIAQEEIQVPFDLANGPLVRLGLVCLRDTEHLLLITLHHIISDGWSLGVLIKELVALYSAYIDDLPSALPELSIQYGDFSCWQRQRLTGETLQRQLDYWKANLSGAQTLLSLPTDRTRPPVQSHSGAALTIVVSAETTKGLLELGIKTRTTLFMTLTAAFNILLSRYSGQSDICLGTPIANRNRSEIESLIGFFVNTLVLRTHVDEDAVFTELLEQVRRTALDAYANQDVPFEQVVETLRPERHLSHSALFQVMLVLQNSPMGSHELPGLVMEPVAAEGVTAKFDLTLNVSQDSSGQLHTLFEYNTDLFDRVTIERMAGHFVRLLEAIVQDPGAQVGTLDMLSNDERKQILIDWNDTATDYPKTQSIHQLFERQVDQDAEAIALIFEGKELTYGELNARANQLAHHLRSVGVSSDTLVGICVERSLEMIVGLLGILKAGGAYVPLDPTYPNDRLAYMIADAKPALLLTQYHLSADLPSIDTVAFCLDSEWEKLRHYSTDNPVHQSSPESLAYVIYTSGSTGVPKGTLLEHGGLCNLIHNHAAQFAIQPQQRILQFASLSFDASTLEIFLALSCGATLCLGARDDLMPGGALEATLTQLEITTAILPPAVLGAMLAQPFPHLKTLFVAGEACPRSLVEQWAGNYQLFNEYGPTEATIAVSDHHCHADRPGPPPIGRPVANMQIYILDRHLKPVPVGVAGELHIAGRGLARGYLNRPDLTDEKFIPNPYGAAGTRMYRSGDLARYAADGSIEYLGRIDNQVKIRGFRIELGEIEAVLSAQENVQDVVVLVRQDGNGDKRLVAYLVMRGEGTSAEALRMALRQSLPDFMVPAAFVMLESFPLTPNGKVDRKALPEPDMSGDNSAYVAPETATEELLATIWADILKVDRVGIHDNFFALGGHSLLAITLFNVVKIRFNLTLPLAAIFTAPTVAMLAKRIHACQRSEALLVPLQSGSGKSPLFCIHPIGGQIFAYKELAAHLGPKIGMPIYGIQSPEAAGLRDQFKTVKEMASVYCAVIRELQPAGPYSLVGWSSGGLIALAIAAELEQQNCEVQYIGLLDSRPVMIGDGITEERIQIITFFNTLATIRGSMFSSEEIVEMEASFTDEIFSSKDFLKESNKSDLIKYFEKFTKCKINDATFEYLKYQLETTKRHLKLLVGFVPNNVKASLHICWAATTESKNNSIEWLTGISGDEAKVRHVDIVTGDHYSMLAEPNIDSLCERIIVAYESPSFWNKNIS